ncbi:hypothetical protein BEL04_13670 [Mucilaginibacter sp. PPCGB 2223]|uniref:hypothetical protein n=1 Tax=Mucilaginibacter sp. PPCGB 2223 TaxID=1886027 RepID=UPI000825100A|nr:hypothetical protein [Mucilaginibacter sp. PPCGB 2223]OCX52504.1 hypothetical protein BEL04_13670 [Mucilaginibacter sp. PPCGB 2223]
MKRITIFSIIAVAFLGIGSLMSGCSLAGLSLQKDYNRSLDDTLDAHVYKTAWGYLKSRAYQNASPSDTIFRRMYDGIIYSGIDTNEYTKPNRTYIFLQNTVVTGQLWAKYKNGSAVGTKWQSYSKTDVKNYLSYLILLGTYTHRNLSVTKDQEIQTLAPAGVYTTNPTTFLAPGTFNPNPNSTMMVHVSNANTVTSQLDYPIVLNTSINVNVSDLLATNGVIDVLSGSTNPPPFFFPPQ